jgi:HSP20 family protein
LFAFGAASGSGWRADLRRRLTTCWRRCTERDKRKTVDAIEKEVFVMNIIPWRNKRDERAITRPAAGLPRLRAEFDELFDRFFRDPWGLELADWFGGEGAWGPRLDLSESDKEVTIRAELPGIEPDDVEINVTGNVLTLRGEKKQEHEEKKRDYHYVERQYGSFHRSVQLPAGVDPDKVDAAYKNGVLTVTIAKRPDALPKKIKVKQG